MTNTNLPNYEGRVVSVSLRGEAGTVKLADPQWSTVNGRLYLVGRWPNHPTDPQRLAGVQTGVAWDDVNHFVVFDSEADFMRRFDEVGHQAPEALSRIQ